jgi:colanic acid biosynthesis glycosyl transferase WcaI
VVLSEAFTDNLVAKGVPNEKIQLIYDPASRLPSPNGNGKPVGPPRVLSMGNIGYSQGLAPLVRAFEREDSLSSRDVKLVITGNGVAADDVRAEIKTDKTEMLGLVDDERLETELHDATLAFVSQRHEGAEFNIPSKIMNFMAYGLPILAAVNPASEVARIVERSGAGWVVDSSQPEHLPRSLAEILRDQDEIRRRATASRAYAEQHFTQDGFALRFDEALREVVSGATSSSHLRSAV